MHIDPKLGSVGTIQGQLLRLSERREVAIYLRGDTLWVADFIDGHGALSEAATWFRFNCGAPGAPYARRRMVLESAIPLSMDLVERIELLHQLCGAHTRCGSPRQFDLEERTTNPHTCKERP